MFVVCIYINMLLSIVFLLYCIHASSSQFLRGSTTPVTVKQLDVTKYTGNWYQIYGAPTNVLFQGYGTCITAKYEVLSNGNVDVLNSQINSNGELDQIGGYAYYKNVSEPGQLSVHLDGVPVDSPYWVVNLGEVKNGQYQYSIITTPSGVSLWVLVRNIADFKINYDAEVKQYLAEHGYKYVDIKQDSDCVYATTQLNANYKTECQIATYLKNAGFSQTNIPTMVCISKYESSYNCDAKNVNSDGSGDYGLFQINSYYWCSGDPLSKYNQCGVSCTSLYDCQANAKCAYTVWKQQGYNAWYGYKYHKAECDSYKIYC